MGVEYGGEEIVEPLFAALQPFLIEVARHPSTGAAIALPDTLGGRAGLLNAAIYDPEVVLVWSKTMTYAHLEVWRNYIQSSRRRVAIVCPSDKGKIDQLQRLEGVPLWSEDTGFRPLDYLPAAQSCRAALYPTNDRKNVPFFVYLPHLMHVHVNHGDSDKHSNASRFSLVYDFVFVADRHAIDRFIQADVPIGLERFLPLGASVFPGVETAGAKTPMRNVLYSPTFEGWQETTNFSSLMRAHARMSAFATDHPDRLCLRAHHATGVRLKDYRSHAQELAQGRDEGPRGKINQFNWSDVMLCDVSGVMSEYLFTNKPIVIPLAAGDTWLRDHIRAAGLDAFCYLWDYDLLDLEAFLATIGDDPLRPARTERRHEVYLGADSFEDSLDHFEDAISYVIDTHRFRQRRSRRPPAAAVSLPALGGTLAEAVGRIRSGELVLRVAAEPAGA